MTNIENSKFLIIDFDKTLIDNDSLYDSIFRLKITTLFKVFVIFLFKGKLALKIFLYKNNLMKYPTYFNHEILIALKANNSFVASASYEPYLKTVLLNVLDQKKIYGSVLYNLKGKRKADFLVNKFGYKNFDYIGDSFSDIYVWKAARNSYTVKRLPLYRLFVPNLKSANDLI